MEEDKRHKEIQKKIMELGEKLGYVAFTEVRLLNDTYSPIVDVVWFNPIYKKLYNEGGQAKKPNNVQEPLCPVEVAFEIENSFAQWGNIQSCIKRIEATGANLGVIVIPWSKYERDEEIKKLKENSQNTSSTRGKWGISAEQDIDNVREWLSQRDHTPRIIVLTRDEIETLFNNQVQEQNGN